MCSSDLIMKLVQDNPDAKVFNYATKDSIINTCLTYGGENFIDFANGVCSFNTPEFIEILEFANTFPSDWEYNENESYPDLVQSGKILLADLYLWDIQEYQMNSLMFNEPTTLIGYPTTPGKSGHSLNGNEMYGIVSKSENKEAAWKFIEMLLTPKEVTRYRMNGFPSNQKLLDSVFASSMEKEYYTDELGNEVEAPKTTWGYDNFTAEIYAATQEEIDTIQNIINEASVSKGYASEIMSIIIDEVAPYFKGQKTAEDVANIIQSRVSIYVSENS